MLAQPVGQPNLGSQNFTDLNQLLLSSIYRLCSPQLPLLSNTFAFQNNLKTTHISIFKAIPKAELGANEETLRRLHVVTQRVQYFCHQLLHAGLPASPLPHSSSFHGAPSQESPFSHYSQARLP